MLIEQTDTPYLSLVDSVVSGSPEDQDRSLRALIGHMPFEESRARRFTNIPGDAEQAVRLGIVEGARSYDPSKGIPVLPYLRLVVRRTVDKTTRRNQADAKATAELSVAELTQPNRFHCPKAKEDFEQIERRAIIASIRSILSDAQNKFLDALVEWDFNAADAARAMGLTPSAGHKMLARIRSHVQASPIAA